jgi:hypothetical protein
MPETPPRPSLPDLPDGLSVLSLLGDSPTSEVFLVEDESGARFALKVLRATVARDPRVHERWQREAALLGELDHPNLVHCHDAFEIDGRPALLLEYIEGPTLREVLRAGPLGWEQATRYGVQIARALGKLHRHGAIHRDVKPHNVLIHPRRGAVLADLGLVRREEDPTLTRQGTALGSPAYMSPEQARDPSDVDEQADVYSLGATLHHCLSGRPPFLGAGVGEVIHRVMHEDPEPLPDAVPDALRRVLAVSLEKERDSRYASAEDFGADLGRVMLGYSPRLKTLQSRRVHRRVLLGSACGVAVLSAVWLMWPDRTEPADLDLQAQGALHPAPESDPALEAAAEPPPLPPDAESDPDAVARAFEQWCQPFALRLLAAQDAGRWRDANAEIEGVSSALVPKDAPAGWRSARTVWIRSAKDNLHAAVERAASRALEVLDQETTLARAAITLGSFDAEEWTAEVMDHWRAAGLRLDDLPLWPGGSDPAGRLKLVSLTLARQAEQERLRVALDSLPGLRASAAALLRSGDFLAARRLWEDAEPALFEHAREARFELARTDELLALQRRLEARLRELRGKEVSLDLRDGGTLAGAVVPSTENNGHAIDYHGQSHIPVDLLLLDADFALSWLGGQENSWLAAHLLWCQDRVARAAERVETLDAATLPEEWAPAFWAVEWRTEAITGASDQEVGAEGEPILPPDPRREPGAEVGEQQDEFLRGLRRRFPQAALTLRGDAVELALTDVSLTGAWSLDLRQELRFWRLTRWEISWRLGIGADPPRRLRWLEGVELLSPIGAVPEVLLDGASHPGFGIFPGQGPQMLVWENGRVLLDGVLVGTCQAPRRSNLTASSDGEFTLASVRLQFLPR